MRDELDLLDLAADAVAMVDPLALTVDELAHGSLALQRHLDRVRVLHARLVRAADNARVWQGTGSRDMADWLARQTKTSYGDASSRVRLGEALDQLAGARRCGRARRRVGRDGGGAARRGHQPARERGHERTDRLGEGHRPARREGCRRTVQGHPLGRDRRGGRGATASAALGAFHSGHRRHGHHHRHAAVAAVTRVPQRDLVRRRQAQRGRHAHHRATARRRSRAVVPGIRQGPGARRARRSPPS